MTHHVSTAALIFKFCIVWEQKGAVQIMLGAIAGWSHMGKKVKVILRIRWALVQRVAPYLPVTVHSEY